MKGIVFRGLLAGVAALLFALSGCVVSPQPSPPNLQVGALDPNGRVGDICQDCVRLDGNRGAVTPPEGIVVLTVLDDDVPLGYGAVRANGGFSVTVTTAMRDSELRVSARNGRLRSAPIDGRIDRFVFTPSAPNLPCLIVAPELDVDGVEIGRSFEARVALRNDCDAEIVLAPSRLREAATPFAIESDVDRLAPGETRSIVLRGVVTTPPTGAATQLAESTLFVTATEPSPDRRPITLFVHGED